MSKHECLEWRTSCGKVEPFEADEYNIGYGPGDVEPCIDCDSPVHKACVAVVHVSEPSREALIQKVETLANLQRVCESTLASQKALLVLADLVLAAAVPSCACGQLATYETRHRYATNHPECDVCMVRRVQECNRRRETDPGRRQPVSLESDCVDTADSSARRLPSATSVRAWLAAKNPVPVLGICPSALCAERGVPKAIVDVLGKAECFRCGRILEPTVTTKDHRP